MEVYKMGNADKMHLKDTAAEGALRLKLHLARAGG